MFRSIRSRLWLSYALLIVSALLVVTVSVVFYLVSNPLELRQAKQKLNIVQELLLATRDEWGNLPANRLEREFRRRAKNLNVRIFVLDEKRQVLIDSGRNENPPIEFKRLTRLIQTVYDDANTPWLYNWETLGNNQVLVVATERPRVAALNLVSDELLPPLLFGGGAALVLALFLAYGLARWVADPLQQMVSAAKRFPEQGAKPLPVEGPQEVRELLAAFNQMQARVETSQRSQKEFVANVSHELKTPLTSVQGFAQAILDGTAETPEAQKNAAQIIYDEAGRMHRLVLALLDLARLDAGMLEIRRAPLDLQALANRMVEKFGPQASAAGLTLLADCPALPPTPADGDRLAQVLGNLLENAIKFTPAGGLITLGGQVKDGGVELWVQDSGIGIAEKDLPHIFERFYQADPARARGKKQGAGLGLAIAHEIIRAHSGKMSVRSLPGKGSQFVIWLPGADPDASTLIRKKK